MVLSTSFRRALAPTLGAGVLAGVLSATSYASDPVPTEIPRGLVEAVRASFAEHPCEAQIRATSATDAWEASSRGGSMTTRFTGDRIEVFDSNARSSAPFGLQLESTGRTGAQEPVREATVSIDSIADGDSIVEYCREGYVEWYINDARGLEQGFTFDVRPAGDGPLELRLAVLGGYEGHAVDERSMHLTSPNGPAVDYSGLVAWDAKGNDLQAELSFQRTSGELVIQVDDEGATYPVTIDPIVTFADFVLRGSDSSNGDLFGKAIAVSSDLALVGAPENDAAGQNAGSAYVFRRSGTTWTEEAILTSPDAADFELFGAGVAIRSSLFGSDWAVVGAPGDIDNTDTSGKAYVFTYDGTSWTSQQTLMGSDAARDDLFGASVAVTGPTTGGSQLILVGAPGNDDAGSRSGSAYVYAPNTFERGTAWFEEQILTATDAGPLDMFGTSVGIWGDRCVIGSPGDDIACTDPIPQNCDSGSAYVYTRFDDSAVGGFSWGDEFKLLAGEPANEDQFGTSVAICNRKVLVGAPFDDDRGLDAGTAYTFVRSGNEWLQEGQILPPNLVAGDHMGHSVCLFGNIGVAGAPGTDNACPLGFCDSGSAFVFVGESGYSLGDPGDSYNGLAYDPGTDTLYASDTTDLYSIDTATGLSTNVGSFVNATGIEGLAFDRNTGTLYGMDTATLALYTINTSNGLATFVGAGSVFIFGIAFDPNSNTLYGTGAPQRLFTINTGNGAMSAVGSPGSLGSTSIMDLAYDENTDTLYGYDSVTREFVAIDTATGEASDVGTWGPFATTEGLAFDPNSDTLLGTQVFPTALLSVSLPSWTTQAELNPRFSAAGDRFGRAVSLFDGQVGVGRELRNSGHVFRVGGGSDTCAGAHHIGGKGHFLFDNVARSTDGVPHPSCLFPNDSDLIRIGSAVDGEEGSGRFQISYVCPICPSTTLASSWEAPNPVVAAQMLARLRRLRDAMQGSPNGRRLVNLYYTHGSEMSRILRENPRLRRAALALIDLLTPGIESLVAEGAEGGAPEDTVFSGQAVMLLDTLLRGLEEENVDGDLALAIRAERHRQDLGELAGKSFAEVWQMIAPRDDAQTAQEAKSAGR
jgi:hypothetical protein